MNLSIQPLTTNQICAMLQWQYDGPYALYNMQTNDEAGQIAFFSDPANGYFAIVNEIGEFLGTCNYGADGRVPGGTYDDSAIDIGISMRPDLTGKGNGHIYAAAVFNFARQHYPTLNLRVTIAEFNGRSQRVCEKHGFQITQRFVRESDQRPFVIMTGQ
ncbi:MAG: GNAT family N-acetyltransferase [Ardenticatenaceae bacterium]|nr:GNAT family N-acetyltransferase [Anaerolineales bacterium]MCB8923855.1 GNAT family N-acetyltransferase [Ardenticatenaceae bacterium]MCB9003366.1 GNAT family N-acetyltransferase [Ardenticatenaceae bacterium]